MPTKRLGKAIRGLMDSPAKMRRITGTLIFVSLIEWAVAGIFGWVNSVAYVSHLSQLSITISLIPWWQGLRLEVQAAENDVVERIVHETTLEKIEDSGRESE